MSVLKKLLTILVVGGIVFGEARANLSSHYLFLQAAHGLFAKGVKEIRREGLAILLTI